MNDIIKKLKYLKYTFEKKGMRNESLFFQKCILKFSKVIKLGYKSFNLKIDSYKDQSEAYLKLVRNENSDAHEIIKYKGYTDDVLSQINDDLYTLYTEKESDGILKNNYIPITIIGDLPSDIIIENNAPLGSFNSKANGIPHLKLINKSLERCYKIKNNNFIVKNPIWRGEFNYELEMPLTPSRNCMMNVKWYITKIIEKFNIISLTINAGFDMVISEQQSPKSIIYLIRKEIEGSLNKILEHQNTLKGDEIFNSDINKEFVSTKEIKMKYFGEKMSDKEYSLSTDIAWGAEKISGIDFKLNFGRLYE